MCGLVGQTTTFNHGFSSNEVDMFNLAMFFNQLRGRDSTGMVNITKKGGYEWIKEVGGLDALLNLETYAAWRSGVIKEGKFVFGHGRSATRGVVSTDNAHPFDVKKDEEDNRIVLVHNGTLHMNQELGDIKEGNVDSWWMASMIAKHGPPALQKIGGAMATIFWDSAEEKLYIYRNDQRPLYYAWTKQRKLLLNSEGYIIAGLRMKFGLDFEEKDIQAIPPMKLHVLATDKWDNFEVSDLPRIYPVYTPSPNYGYNPTNHNSHHGRRQIGYQPPVTPITPNNYSGPKFTSTVRHRESINPQTVLENTIWYNGSIKITNHEELVDAALLDLGKLKSIVWRDGKKFYNWMSGNILEQPGTPYKPFLVSMVNKGRGEVVRNFISNEGNPWYTTITKEPRNHVMTSLINPLDNTEKGGTETAAATATVIPFSRRERAGEGVRYKILPAKPGKIKDTDLQIPCRLAVGKKFHFNSTDTVTGQVVKHEGKVSKDHARYFEFYANDQDGPIQVGDEVQLEVIRVSSTVQGHMVYGYKLDADGRAEPQAVLYTFWMDKEYSADEIRNTGFYEGNVEFLRAVDHSTHNSTGCYVEAGVGQIRPCYAKDDPKVVVTRSENGDEYATVENVLH